MYEPFLVLVTSLATNAGDKNRTHVFFEQYFILKPDLCNILEHREGPTGPVRLVFGSKDTKKSVQHLMVSK